MTHMHMFTAHIHMQSQTEVLHAQQGHAHTMSPSYQCEGASY